MKKYEFTGETKEEQGITLRRIRRLSDGKIGGWIESEDNLSHEGAAWVSDNARVYDNAQVSGNARVSDKARVFGNALVSDKARVFDNAWVSDKARVFDNAWVSDNARVYDNAQVFGNARVSGEALVFDNARVSGKAWVKYSRLTTNFHDDIKAALRASLNVGVINQTVRLYKYVRRTNDRTFASVYDPDFLYRIGETVETEADPDPAISCGAGLHASTLDYWEGNDDANACIAVDVRVDDIICVLEGKVRCKRLTVVGIVENSVHTGEQETNE